jgi:hypothetical protein
MVVGRISHITTSSEARPDAARVRLLVEGRHDSQKSRATEAIVGAAPCYFGHRDLYFG